MANDYIYYYTKDTFEQRLLGEIQSNFNMSKVIDGTKDSMKVQVLNFSGEEIEPYTILEHRATNTWWIVSHDKVERDMNESGFRYTHNLQLLGAIELLNARDLTDCGFNQNTYTIEEILYRLCQLSNFEFANNPNLNFEISSDELDINQNVDYMKTFENYTLLSALREVVDGYNCDIKLSFETTQDNILYNALLTIIPKTGFSNKELIQESLFSDIRETKTMDKNSFGTTVVSNAENVVSTKNKTFPNTGAIRLSGSAYEITSNNAFIRLPSNIFKVNWVRMFFPISISVSWYISNRTTPSSNPQGYTSTYIFYGFDENSVNSMFEKIVNDAYTNMRIFGGYIQDFETLKNNYFANKESILRPIILGGRTTFYSGWTYNPVNGNFIAPTNNPDFYFPIIYRYYGFDSSTNGNYTWVMTEKQIAETIHYPDRCLRYTKGDNKIENFNILGIAGSQTDYSYISGFQYTDLRDSSYNATLQETYHQYYEDTIGGTGGAQLSYLRIGIQALRNVKIGIENTYYVVDYVPMTNLKIKYDNSGTRNDTQIYNQNGKLSDGVALSKLLLSYTKEIESDTITKYACFYDYEEIPSVGDMVSIGNDIYVINNISYDFYENESVDILDNDDEVVGQAFYYIECEFTMSKKVGAKSLLTNPNSNIRDYGIPQNNNVVRKQLYRDFYELAHTIDTQASNDYYLPLDKIMNVSNRYKDYQEHIAVIKLGYEKEVDGKYNWYYQLDTTTYILKKAIYEVVDFNDNNIIGYSSQNTVSEFDISRLFSGLIDVKNTPISYTDYDGKVLGFEIAFCTNEQLTKIYDDYKRANNYESNPKPIFNYSIFIDKDIYEGGDYGQSISYQGVIESGTIENDMVFGFYFELTQYLSGYTGSENDIGVGELQLYDVFFEREIPSSEYTYSFTKSSSGNRYYIKVVINPNSSYQTALVKLTIVNVLRGGFVGATYSNDFKIEEPTYQKDALEVPFFEYSCQIDNSEDVIIGDNILDTKNDTFVYMYSYVLVPKNQVNENNAYKFIEKPIGTFDDYNHFIVNVAKGIKMTYENNKLKINFYDNESYDVISDTFTQGTIAPIVGQFENELKTHDLMIVRHKVNEHTTYHTVDNVKYVDSIDDLMFVIRNTNNAQLDSFNLYLEINHYRIR